MRALRSIPVPAALSALLGSVMLAVSFSINNGPPENATGRQLTEFIDQNRDSIAWGAWLQAVGPVFIVYFTVTIVVLAGATGRPAGWMTLFGAATLMTVNLIEVVCYLTQLQTHSATMPRLSTDLIRGVQHLYFFVAAPLLFVSLGVVILGSSVLPRLLGYLAILLGAAFAVAGIATVPDITVPVAVQLSASIQVLWWVAAASVLLVRAWRERGRNTDAPNRIRIR
ncbi:hypothetical protein [Nocardia sp. CDC160]|uniref:hypothetical protein n=1 Tax=Nocardia sp. CDC160 TaxID=3112166 RepID=UPI002DBC5DB6|nr:hypothetical protein [Nocardia sp. CDC160]MEC3917611.1 hypothetical protein [Nocardia sp. CDC160]